MKRSTTQKKRELSSANPLAKLARAKLSSVACNGSLRNGTMFFCVFNIAVGVEAVLVNVIFAHYYSAKVGFVLQDEKDSFYLKESSRWTDYAHGVPAMYGCFSIFINLLGLFGAWKRKRFILKVFFIGSLLHMLFCIISAQMIFLWVKVHFFPFEDPCKNPFPNPKDCKLETLAKLYQKAQISHSHGSASVEAAGDEEAGLHMLTYFRLEGWVYAHCIWLAFLIFVQFLGTLWFLPATYGLWRVLEVGGTGDECKSADELVDEELGMHQDEEDEGQEADESSPLLSTTGVEPHWIESFTLQAILAMLDWMNVAFIVAGFFMWHGEDWKAFQQILPQEKFAVRFNGFSALLLMIYTCALMWVIGFKRWFVRKTAWLETAGALVNFIAAAGLWYYIIYHFGGSGGSAQTGLSSVHKMLLLAVVLCKPQLFLVCKRMISSQERLIRSVISEKKRRFMEEGFDLDLTYITPRIVAMGFPCEGAEASMRNNIEEVQLFLHTKHPRRHKVFNLCAERDRMYRPESFAQVSQDIQFPDHNPCPLDELRMLLECQHDWLAEAEDNIAVIHCKAGKGRTGVVCACLLLREGVAKTAEDALAKFADMRTTNGKGVTNPSQIRNVELYAISLRENAVRQRSIQFPKFRLTGVPEHIGTHICVQVCNPAGDIVLEDELEEQPQVGSSAEMVFTLRAPAHQSCTGRGTLWHRQHKAKAKEFGMLVDEQSSPPGPGILSGDFKVSVLHTVGKLVTSEEVLLSFWLHSGYVNDEHELVLSDLDSVKKYYSSFPKDFKVACTFETASVVL